MCQLSNGSNSRSWLGMNIEAKTRVLKHKKKRDVKNMFKACSFIEAYSFIETYLFGCPV